MHKLLPLLALTATGCGGGLPVVDVSLGDLPNPSFHAEVETEAGGEFTYLQPEQDGFQGPCHRLPSTTRLTANGQALAMESPGGTTLEDVIHPHAACRVPVFKAPTLPDAPRTEFIVSDGKTQRRAVFLGLRAVRSFRVNGQTQGTARSGQELDLEWSPATDVLDSMELLLRAEGSAEAIQMKSYRREGHHLYVTFAPVAAGRYVLTASGRVNAGVEACEGFSTCEAPSLLYNSRAVTVPVLFEPTP